MASSAEPRFACDAMLCGLARWLRAAGYDAFWQYRIDDQDLIRRSRDEERILLSSDTKLFHHRLIRDNVLPALFVPLRLRPQEQLAYVLVKGNLPLRQPRCMACGGNLVEVSKDEVRDRVPARTFAWLDRFWECDRCRRIFWHGTHWQRITHQLRLVAGSQAGLPTDAGKPHG